MKHYKTIGLMFVFALMMLVTGAGAQTEKESAVKAAAPAAAADRVITSRTAPVLVAAPPVQNSSPFQVGHKYMVTSSQSPQFVFFLVDAIKGDWIQVKVYENAAFDKPVFGSGMWFNTVFLTSAGEHN